MSGDRSRFEFLRRPSERLIPSLAARARSFARKSIYVLAGQGLGLIFGFAGTFILSHYVSKADYANYALLVSVMGVGIITHGGLINFATRFWSQDLAIRPARWHFILRSFWKNTPILIGVTLLGLFLARSQIQAFSWLLFPLAILSTIGVVRLTLQASILNSAEDYRRFFFLNALGTTLKFAGPIGFACLYRGSFFSLAAGFAVYAAGAFLACAFFFRPITGPASVPAPATSLEWTRSLRSYGRPFVWVGVGSWFLQFADRWIASAFFDPDKVADFSYATQIVTFFPVFLASWLLQIAYPGFFRHVDTHQEKSDWRSLGRKADLLLLVFLALTAAGTLLAYWTFKLLLGNLISVNYENSLALVFPAMMVATALQANQFHYLLLQASLNSGAIMRITIWVSLTKTLLSIGAAFVSWQALQLSWIAAPIVVGLLGRFLVNRVISRRSPFLVGR